MKYKSFIAQFKISENWISSFKYFSKQHGFTWPKGLPRGGGVLPEKLGRGVRPASQNPYPIYDQNGGKMAKIDTQFMTKTAEKP